MSESEPHSELHEAMERANDSWHGRPYPVGPGVSQEFARAVQDRTTLAAEVSRLEEQLEAAHEEILFLCSDEDDIRRGLREQLQAERREEWREGLVNVLDHEGNYVGCMGSETWQWTLDGGLARLKEQLETAQEALRAISAVRLLTGNTVGRDELRGCHQARIAMQTIAREALASSPAKEPS